MVTLVKTNSCETPTDANAGYGTLYCGRGYNGCPGATEGDCFPYHIWSNTEVESFSFHNALVLYEGVFSIRTSTCAGTGGNGRCGPYAFSVRCVLDLIFSRKNYNDAHNNDNAANAL